MKTKILADFQICISVPLSLVFILTLLCGASKGTTKECENKFKFKLISSLRSGSGREGLSYGSPYPDSSASGTKKLAENKA